MEEIELGARICEKIKDIYYSNEQWQTCYMDIAAKLNLFKKIMKKIYPSDSIVKIFKKVHKFDTMDIQEIFDMENDYLKEEVKTSETKKKYGDDVIWLPVPINKMELLEEFRSKLR